MWLRELLLEFESTERAAFLQYVTSCPRLPAAGKLPAGHIVVDRKDVEGLLPEAVLPTARTCTNQLRLPLYSDKATLAAKLRIAFKFNTTFGAD